MKREDLYILVNANESGEIFYDGLYTNLNEAIGEAMQSAGDLSESYKDADDEFKVSLPEWLSSGAGWLITVTYKKAGWVKPLHDYYHILTGDRGEAAAMIRAGEKREEVLKEAGKNGNH